MIKATIEFKPLGIVYVVLISLVVFYEYGYYAIPVIFITMIAATIWVHQKELPQKQQLQLFEQMFSGLNLHSTAYLYDKELSPFATLIAFNTLIPLKEWQSKKDALEVHMGIKIIDIKQDINDYRKVNVIVQSQVLPTYIEFSDNFLYLDDDILSIGYGYYGVVGMDLTKHPHCFIAGETGSGKSNILKCMIYQSLIKSYDVVLIDFKRGVSFSSFSKYVNICYEHESACKVLSDMVKLTNMRLDLFREFKVDNINDFNNSSGRYMERQIIFIDELAELLKVRDKILSNSLYDSIETLTRLSRATGIHLIMGIQRPDSTIVNGQIKNNVSYRVCGRFVDKEPSRIMLGNDIASKLPNIKGRFIIKDDELKEVQSFYLTDTSYLESFEHLTLYENTAPDTDCITEITDNLVSEEEIQNETEEEEKLTSDLEFSFDDIKK